MNLTPITSPRVAQVPGAQTVSASQARDAAMAKFNEGMQSSGQSPSEPGAVLDPTTAAATENIPQSPLNDAGTTHLQVEQPASTEATKAEQEAARISSHYANLARKEKMLRMREARINQKMQEITRPTAPEQPFDASKYVNKDELVNNPFGVLNTLGLTYEQLTQKALDAPSAEDMEQRREIALLKNEIQALKTSQESVQKNYDEQQIAARKQAELQIRQDVNRLLQTDPDFEVTRTNRAAGEVVKLITSVYDRGMGREFPRGTILDVYLASQMVENELTERALRIAKLTKIQSQLGKLGSGVTKQQSNNQQPSNSQLRTLTNGVGTSTRKLTSRERALAAFRGEAV